MPFQGTSGCYQRIIAEVGGRAKIKPFARLFMAPGMGHCRYGSGAAPADPLTALVKWVEQGKPSPRCSPRTGP
ncbi:tannase/feruloyl esterase family alpha/beta hydrolase [Streptomyces sp. NPDC001652]|uniref:tannase/feruloyl esterase family alpha/beta hydrolase n=1 Tax=Streptomyces sp. NPDC001652 TaxID=3154393 RepID=UPI0033271359